MASIVNADNGVSSGSAGLKSSADSSGVLALQTNGTTAVTVDTSQNVGIGTTSPAADAKLVISKSGAAGLEFSIDNATSGSNRIFSYNRSTSAGVPLVFNTGVGNSVTFDSSGNVTMTGTLTTSSRGIAKASMPSGSVLQVVNGNYSTSTTNNTSTMASTGLTASITPLFSTSKILIILSVSGIYKFTNNTGAILQLYRGGSNVFQFEYTGGGNNSTNTITYSSATTYLDSPATTSATSYTVYFASQQNNAGITVQLNGGTSTITLMEIAV